MTKCNMCKRMKPQTAFWKKSRNSRDLSPRCKSCDRKAKRKSRQRHLVDRRRREREYARQKRMSGQKQVLTPEQKKANTTRLAAYYDNHLDRYLAKMAVRAAVLQGELVLKHGNAIRRSNKPFLLKPPFCQLCGRPTQKPHLHAHHYLGYEKVNWLSVMFICRDCHGAVTALERDAILVGQPAITGLASFILEQREKAGQMLLATNDQPVPRNNVLSISNRLEMRNAS